MCGSHDREGDGQIKRRSVFADACWREVDKDAILWKLEAGIAESRPRPFPRLPHCGLGKSGNVRARYTSAYVGFHPNDDAVSPKGRVGCYKHGVSLLYKRKSRIACFAVLQFFFKKDILFFTLSSLRYEILIE
jgi:hypothetical protein